MEDFLFYFIVVVIILFFACCLWLLIEYLSGALAKRQWKKNRKIIEK